MFEDNLKKGKTAEKIVEQMFKEAGFKVVPSGIEKTFPQLADQYNLLQGPAGSIIRHLPDFIVVNSNNEAFLIEVKYRKFGVIDQKDIFYFPATQVILLTKDSMHCQSLKDIYRNGKKFLPLDCLKPFSDIPQEIRKKYIKKTKRLLGDENLMGQFIEKISEEIVRKKFIQSFTPGHIKFTFIEDFNNQGDDWERIRDREIITNKSGAVKFFNHGKQWNNNEIKKLLDLYRLGKSINDIASILHRKRKAVVFRLVRENVLNIHDAVTMVKGKKWEWRRRRGGRNQRKRRHRH